MVIGFTWTQETVIHVDAFSHTTASPLSPSLPLYLSIPLSLSLSQLMPLTTRVDPIVTDLLNGISQGEPLSGERYAVLEVRL